MTYRDVVRRLRQERWKLAAKRAAIIYSHQDKEGIVVVAGQLSSDVPRSTLNSIKKQAGCASSTALKLAVQPGLSTR